mgnify:CR=1 FL=1
MYCSWIGKICIFVTMINSQDKILQKTEHMIYFHIMFMSASSIKRKSTLLLREATRSFYIQISDNISGQETFERECFSRLQIRDAYPKMIIARTKHPQYSYEGIVIHDIAIGYYKNKQGEISPAFQYPCSFVPYNCKVTRRFSAHSSLFQYSTGTSTKTAEYVSSCHSSIQVCKA